MTAETKLVIPPMPEPPPMKSRLGVSECARHFEARMAATAEVEALKAQLAEAREQLGSGVERAG